MDLYEHYLKDIRNYELLDAQQENELSRQIQNGSQSALNKLINSNLRLVVSIAKKFTVSYKFSLMDLIQEGNIGLMVAAKKFSYAFNTRFSTYAYTWIFQYMLRFVHNKTSIIELPHRKEKLIRTAKSSKLEFLQEYGFEPSISELASYMGVDEVELAEAKAYMFSVSSLDMECSDDNGDTVGDLLPDMTFNPEKKFFEGVEKEEVADLLRTLPEKERVVISGRYNFEGNQHVPTLRELSSTLGVSAETIRQMEIRAIKRLRKTVAA